MDQQPEDVRQISKRKVLYVDLDEEITVLYQRIGRLPYKDVYLVVPERAVLFQSVVNLSILKKKIHALGKTLSLITSDSVGTKLAHQAEIPVFDQMAPPERPVGMTQEEEALEDGEFNVPIAAARNEVEEEGPIRMKQKKISIYDVVQRKKAQGLSFSSLRERVSNFRKNRELQKEPSKFALGAPSAKTMGTLIVASLCVLLVISYVALPGATLSVTPKSNVMEHSVNITLANANIYGTNPSLGIPGHVLPYFPIDVTVEEETTYTATGQIFGGTNASGFITVVNEREAAWPLVAFSRFQNEDGIVFRSQEAVTIPRASSTGPGTLQVFVVADEEDAYGRVVGERGNIGPSDFVLPGLREDSQRELYARSSDLMTGGSTAVTLKITEEDLEAARQVVNSDLEKRVEDALQAEVNRRNSLNGTELQILSGFRAFDLDEPNIDIPDYLLEAVQDQFEASGQLSAHGFAFNGQEFINLLTQELKQRKSPDKALTRIDHNSITYEVVEKFEEPGQIKITATIKGIEAYALDPEDENGARLIKKIKEHIAGKPLKEAQDYVQNLPEINKVTISSWPVWAPTIPSVFENIEIKLAEELEDMAAE